MRALEPCPKCKSGDVGGASGIVHCYRCKDEVRAATTPEAADMWNARAIFLRHGLPVDSEQFHAAARALLEADRERRCDGGEAAMQRACAELPDGFQVHACMERGAGWVDVYGPDGERIDFDADTDGGMTARINAATDMVIREDKAFEEANRED